MLGSVQFDQGQRLLEHAVSRAADQYVAYGDRYLIGAVIRLNFTTPLLNPLDIKGMTKAPCNTMTHILNGICGYINKDVNMHESEGCIKLLHMKCSSWQIQSLYRLLRLTKNCHRLQRLTDYEKHKDASQTFKGVIASEWYAQQKHVLVIKPSL
ncbi:MAG: hypothetical protein FRX49_03848 [Trebouxia sp. A1-2]|nr:MAG: hypothetical protein FRX49_03848 [Trebouxia sp. A1-2]